MLDNAMTALNNQPTVDNIPAEDLKKSADDRARSDKDTIEVDFTEWARLILKVIDGENQEEEMRRVRKITKLMMYYRGNQRGFWSAHTGDWVPMDPDAFEPRDAAMLLINNQIRPMVKSLAKEWARSRSRLKVVATDDTVEKKGAARYATAVLTKKQDKLMPESFRQTEGKSAFLAGNYLRYTCYDKKAKGAYAAVPEVEKFNEKTHEDYAWCPSCGRNVDMGHVSNSAPAYGGEDTASCPHCGFSGVQVQRGEEQNLSRMKKVKKVRVGHQATRLVDVREVKVHVRARTLDQTPYLRWRQYVLRSTLKEQFRWATIKPVTPSPITRYIQETELNTGSSGGVNKTSLMSIEEYGAGMGGMTEFVRLWVRPSMYFDLRAKRDLKLGDGEIMKRGDKFIERYPDGMYIAFCGEELLDVKGEVLDRYWAHGAYEKLIESFWGDGVDDLVAMQQLVNEMQSLFVENIIYNASPKIIYNPFLIEAAMLDNNPSQMTPMSRNAKRDDNPKEAIYQMSGMSIGRDVPDAKISAIEDMRTQSGAHLAMQGANDPRLNTATAMAIARDASIASLGTPLALKSEVDVVWARQVLALEQEYWVDGVSDKALGNYSLAEAQWFKECDIETDLEITVEAGSWVPRTEQEVKMDFLEFVTAGGIPLGFANPQVPYEIKQRAAELLRMPLDLDKLQPDIRNAHLRVEQLQAASRVLLDAGVINESTDDERIIMLLISDVPVDMYIDDHPTFISTYTAWLKTDEGRFAPACVADAVKLLIQRHDEAIEKIGEQQFQEEAKYALAAQALQGMVQNEQQAQQVATQTEADIAKEGAKQGAQAAASRPTEPMPMNSNSKPPATGQAAARSSAPTA